MSSASLLFGRPCMMQSLPPLRAAPGWHQLSAELHLPNRVPIAHLASFCLASAVHPRYPAPLPPYKHSSTPNMALRDTKEGAWTYGFFNDLFADPAVCE